MYPNQDKIGQEREKKNLVPNTVPTQPGLENSKKIAKIFKKLKNIILSIFLSKPGDEICREREKKKNLLPNSVPTQPWLENSKRIAKKFKKLKNIISALFPTKPG